MAGMCCGVVGDSEAATTVATVEPRSRPVRRRRFELLQLVADVALPPLPSPQDSERKRRKVDVRPRECDNAVDNSDKEAQESEKKRKEQEGLVLKDERKAVEVADERPRFGMTSVCGRRRDMEDAVSIHTSFCEQNSNDNSSSDLHFFGVFDGHGCSHVATRCKDRMHDILKEEIRNCKDSLEWKETMEKSFDRMDREVKEWSEVTKTSECRCELQAPHCDAVGSTAVVAVVTPDKIVVSNCGDSRAVLCRNGVAIPLSSDHKPDRPDELLRIQNAGGRVIYWDGPRVLGVLAMSRAIGDNYLKPYVISEPEVTIIDRTAEDECLILASDGLWDVVSNDTACGVARKCLRAQKLPTPAGSPGLDVSGVGNVESSDNCSDASILLTKLALARHTADNVSVVVVDLRRNQ